jgi:hypothetical protein
MKSEVGEKIVLNAALMFEPTLPSKAASVDCRKKSPPSNLMSMSFQNGAIRIGVGMGNGDGMNSMNPLLNVRCPWLLICRIYVAFECIPYRGVPYSQATSGAVSEIMEPPT